MRISVSGEHRTGRLQLAAAGALLLAALAISAIATTSSAAALEFGVCRNIVKKGEYTDVNCQTKSAKPHKGTYEWQPGPPKSCLPMKHGEYLGPSCLEKDSKPHKGKYELSYGGNFHTPSGVAPVEITLGAHIIYCPYSYIDGHIVSSSEAIEEFSFGGCELDFTGEQCESEGTFGPGGIYQFGLSVLLDVADGPSVLVRSPITGDLFGGFGGYIQCEPSPGTYEYFRITPGAGQDYSFISTTDVSSAKFTEEFNPGTASQGAEGEQFEGISWAPLGRAGLEATFADEVEGPIEIKSP